MWRIRNAPTRIQTQTQTRPKHDSDPDPNPDPDPESDPDPTRHTEYVSFFCTSAGRTFMSRERGGGEREEGRRTADKCEYLWNLVVYSVKYIIYQLEKITALLCG